MHLGKKTLSVLRAIPSENVALASFLYMQENNFLKRYLEYDEKPIARRIRVMYFTETNITLWKFEDFNSRRVLSILAQYKSIYSFDNYWRA